jgi:hypothetical protein
VVSSARRSLSFERPSGVDVSNGLRLTRTSNDQIPDWSLCANLFTELGTIRMDRERIKPLDSSCQAPKESKCACSCTVLSCIKLFDLGDNARRVSCCDHKS